MNCLPSLTLESLCTTCMDICVSVGTGWYLQAYHAAYTQPTHATYVVVHHTLAMPQTILLKKRTSGVILQPSVNA